MFTLFPQILFLAPLAATLLRVTLALTIGVSGWKHGMQRDWTLRIFGLVELVLGGLLLVGAWTQAVGLAAAVLALVWLLRRESRIYIPSTVFLVLVIALSLTILGAGAFAVDLPL